MPISISIEDKAKTLEKLAASLSGKQLTTSKVRALNTAIKKARTKYRREIVRNYNLVYADTKDMVIMNLASYTTPEATIKGSIRPFGLSHFKPTFIKNGQKISIASYKNKETGKRALRQKAVKAAKKAQSNGVELEVIKGEKRRLPSAFLIQSQKPGISKQIFARGTYSGSKFNFGGKRYPIQALKTTSAYATMTNEKVSADVESEAVESMQKEFERQIHLVLKRAGAR